MTVLLLLLALAGQAAPDPLVGYWTNRSGSVVVLIAPCGDGAWCGTVQYASDKARMDAARGGTPNLVGTELMHKFVEVAPGRWKGSLFVPDLKTHPKAELSLLDDSRLNVRGCAVGRLLCKSETWTRTMARMPDPDAAKMTM